MVLLCFLWSSTYAQPSLHINGYVTASESGECLIGAVVSSGKNWVVTNEYGFFSLPVQTGENTVSFSHLGRHADDLCVHILRDTLVSVVMIPVESLEGAIVVSGFSPVSSAYMGVIDIPSSYIKDMPALLGEPDLLKTLQKMPGVQAGTAGFSGIYVRGGGAEENLVLMDGAPLYNVSHLLGLFSAFSPESVKQVTMYKGFFPAKYGGRSSSVIDVRTNDGNVNDFCGAISIGLINSRLHLEGPICRGKTSFSLSARGTNTLTLLPLVQWLNSPYSYYFYDVTGKLTHRWGNSDRLCVMAYHGSDKFKYAKSETTQFQYLDDSSLERTGQKSSEEQYDLFWGNTVAAIRWNHNFGGRVFSDMAVSWSDYRMRENSFLEEKNQTETLSGYSNRHSNHSAISDLNATWDLECRLSAHQEISFGLSHTFHAFRPEKDISQHVIEAGEATDRNVSFTNGNQVSLLGTESALYGEDAISLGPLHASIGLRAALYTTSGSRYPSIEPRISSEYKLSPSFSVKAAYARMSQYVHLLASGHMNLPTDLWVPITKNIKPITTDHFSVGFFCSPSDGWNFTLEAYYKKENNVLEYKDGQLVFTSATDWEETVEMGEGMSKGVEFLCQKTKGKLTGMFAYTLSKTDRVFPEGTINAGEPFPFTYDRRHVLDCFVRYSINDKISLSGAWYFASGNMITASWRSTVIMDPEGLMGHTSYISGRNNYRLPPSHRLDVSADFRKVKKHGERIWSFGVYNLYGAQNPDWVVNVSELSLNDKGQTGLTYHLMKRSFLTFLPSVSYTYRF